MSTNTNVLKRNAKIAKIVEKLHSLKGAPATVPSKARATKKQNDVSAKKALLFKDHAIREAEVELKQKGLSRTPTIYEESSAIEEIAEDIKLREAEAIPDLERLSMQQAEVYAKAVYDAIIAGESIFDVKVPMIKELTKAYTSQMVDAVTTGDSQMLAQLGLPTKATRIPKPSIKAVANILARNYVEKRSMDMRFDLLKASVMHSIDTLLGASGDTIDG